MTVAHDTDLAVGGAQFSDDAGVFRRADASDDSQAHGYWRATIADHLKEVQPEAETMDFITDIACETMTAATFFLLFSLD